MRHLKHLNDHHFHAWMYGLFVGALMGTVITMSVYIAVWTCVEVAP